MRCQAGLDAEVACGGRPRRRQARARACDLPRRELGSDGLRPRARHLPRDRKGVRGRCHGPAGCRQVQPDLGADPTRTGAGAHDRSHLRRSLQSVHAGCAPRRPHPAVRPLPRSRGLHPLDGHTGPPRRSRGDDPAGPARPRRRRQGPRVSRDCRRRTERGRGDRHRRHGAARRSSPAPATRFRL